MVGVKIASPSYRNIERAFLASNSDPSGVLLNAHLTRYWNLVSSSTNRQTYYAVRKLFEFLKSRGGPLIGWGVWAALSYFENRRAEPLDQYDLRVANQKRLDLKKGNRTDRKISFYECHDMFSKILASNRDTENLSESDLLMLDLEAKDWETIYQRKRRQAGEIPAAALSEWGEMVSDPQGGASGRIFAWSFRVGVAAGLIWGDLLNTAPNTLVLVKDGLIGFAAKTKTRGVSEGRPWGGKQIFFCE